MGGSSSVRNKAFARPRPIYADDVVLMVGHTPDTSTATDVNVFLSTDQDW